MNPQIQVKIELTPVFEFDEKAQRYIVYYKQFPKAVASGQNKEEAQLRLIEIFKVMLEEKRHEIREQLISNLTPAELDKLGINFVSA